MKPEELMEMYGFYIQQLCDEIFSIGFPIEKEIKAKIKKHFLQGGKFILNNKANDELSYKKELKELYIDFYQYVLILSELHKYIIDNIEEIKVHVNKEPFAIKEAMQAALNDEKFVVRSKNKKLSIPDFQALVKTSATSSEQAISSMQEEDFQKDLVSIHAMEQRRDSDLSKNLRQFPSIDPELGYYAADSVHPELTFKGRIAERDNVDAYLIKGNDVVRLLDKNGDIIPLQGEVFIVDQDDTIQIGNSVETIRFIHNLIQEYYGKFPKVYMLVGSDPETFKRHFNDYFKSEVARYHLNQNDKNKIFESAKNALQYVAAEIAAAMKLDDSGKAEALNNVFDYTDVEFADRCTGYFTLNGGEFESNPYASGLKDKLLRGGYVVTRTPKDLIPAARAQLAKKLRMTPEQANGLRFLSMPANLPDNYGKQPAILLIGILEYAGKWALPKEYAFSDDSQINIKAMLARFFPIKPDVSVDSVYDIADAVFEVIKNQVDSEDIRKEVNNVLYKYYHCAGDLAEQGFVKDDAVFKDKLRDFIKNLAKPAIESADLHVAYVKKTLAAAKVEQPGVMDPFGKALELTFITKPEDFAAAQKFYISELLYQQADLLDKIVSRKEIFEAFEEKQKSILTGPDYSGKKNQLDDLYSACYQYILVLAEEQDKRFLPVPNEFKLGNYPFLRKEKITTSKTKADDSLRVISSISTETLQQIQKQLLRYSSRSVVISFDKFGKGESGNKKPLQKPLFVGDNCDIYEQAGENPESKDLEDLIDRDKAVFFYDYDNTVKEAHSENFIKFISQAIRSYYEANPYLIAVDVIDDLHFERHIDFCFKNIREISPDYKSILLSSAKDALQYVRKEIRSMTTADREKFWSKLDGDDLIFSSFCTQQLSPNGGRGNNPWLDGFRYSIYGDDASAYFLTSADPKYSNRIRSDIIGDWICAKDLEITIIHVPVSGQHGKQVGVLITFMLEYGRKNKFPGRVGLAEDSLNNIAYMLEHYFPQEEFVDGTNIIDATLEALDLQSNPIIKEEIMKTVNRIYPEIETFEGRFRLFLKEKVIDAARAADVRAAHVKKFVKTSENIDSMTNPFAAMSHKFDIGQEKARVDKLTGAEKNSSMTPDLVKKPKKDFLAYKINFLEKNNLEKIQAIVSVFNNFLEDRNKAVRLFDMKDTKYKAIVEYQKKMHAILSDINNKALDLKEPVLKATINLYKEIRQSSFFANAWLFGMRGSDLARKIRDEVNKSFDMLLPKWVGKNDDLNKIFNAIEAKGEEGAALKARLCQSVNNNTDSQELSSTDSSSSSARRMSISSKAIDSNSSSEDSKSDNGMQEDSDVQRVDHNTLQHH